MAKGASSKEIITAKILETFPGAFKYDKEIRIPMEESGESIQIKVALTCAKTNVGCGEDTAIPGETSINSISDSAFPETAMNAPTEEEKQAVKDLIAKLGI